ncbi:NADH dehydrogenase [ubiquinone] 1 alpha subcomplex assembly factor 8 isoform X2 [Alligator mississippiensis]|uniref:NADH dehydrogenase [ubiquinone] 1 alpha subcomplex assembly factor 8 isoform X2 n=1 Tax=Alligator mississippiensis TaxID=8496 RepID=UPI0009074F9A|nr:NADH dehydrogenase [ubiquinone] 1 alpha subcomplex assembly factor 8 isoform X2 [Alligator mississippiensis]
MRGEREQRPMGRRPNMAAPWLRARERLRRIPELLAGCRDQAAAYGRCVAAATAGRAELRKDACAQEFEALRACVARAAKAAAK